MAERGEGAKAPAAQWSIPTVLLGSAAVVLSGLALRLLTPVPPPDDSLRETVRIFEQFQRDFPDYKARR